MPSLFKHCTVSVTNLRMRFSKRWESHSVIHLLQNLLWPFFQINLDSFWCILRKNPIEIFDYINLTELPLLQDSAFPPRNMIHLSHPLFLVVPEHHGVDIIIIVLQTRTLRLRKVTSLSKVASKIRLRGKPTAFFWQLKVSLNGTLNKLKKYFGIVTFSKHLLSTCCVPDIGNDDE